MIYPSLQQLLVAALCLLVPAAIVLGHRRPSGPIIICSSAALGAFAAFWLLLGGINSLYVRGASGSPPIGLLLLFGGLFLLFAAWALALNAAAQARRTEWVILLTVAGYISVAAIIFSISQPDPCIFGPPPGVEPFGLSCTATYPFERLLIIAGYLVGPAATLAYGLRLDGLSRRSRVLPEGVSVSSLRAPTGEAAALSDEP